MKMINGKAVSDGTEIRIMNGMESVEKCVSPALLCCGCSNAVQP